MTTNKTILNFLLFIFVVGSLAGCSSLKTYPSSSAKNLIVYLDKKSDSGVEGRADIYLLDKQCQGPYQGSSWFNKSPKKIGIKKGRQTLVSLKYLLSDWLKGKSSITADVLIQARSGYRYEAKLSYIDEAYETFVYEINRRTGKKTPMKTMGIAACVEG